MSWKHLTASGLVTYQVHPEKPFCALSHGHPWLSVELIQKKVKGCAHTGFLRALKGLEPHTERKGFLRKERFVKLPQDKQSLGDLSVQQPGTSAVGTLCPCSMTCVPGLLSLLASTALLLLHQAFH